MIATWCSENNSKNWVDALPVIQAAKNRRYHSGIKRSPYEAMFGRTMTMGISDDPIAPEIAQNLHDEDDLLEAFNMRPPGKPIENHHDDLMPTTSLLRPSQSTTSLSEVENIEEEDENFVDYGKILENIQTQRREAAKNLKIQAERMLKASNKRLVFLFIFKIGLSKN